MTRSDRAPLVSVVMPVWNGERYLAGAIESVLAQTLDSLELVVVDDGSTDASAAIARRFAERDPRVVVVEAGRAGLVAALNLGITRSRAPYVARLDADDRAHPGRLEKQVAFLDAHPECVVLGSDLEIVDEDDEPIGDRSYPQTHAEIVEALMSGHSRTLAHPAVTMRRDSVVTAGGYRAECFPSEDLDLWMRLSSLGELRNLPLKLLCFRRHRGTVGVRQRTQQVRTGKWIVDAYRTGLGLRPLRPRIPPRELGTEATYHYECARIALVAGNRRAAFKHLRATWRETPFWWQVYVAFAAIAFPKETLWRLLKFYGWLRAIRMGGERPDLSEKMGPGL